MLTATRRNTKSYMAELKKVKKWLMLISKVMMRISYRMMALDRYSFIYGTADKFVNIADMHGVV